MRPPERQQSLGLLLFLADRLNPARPGVRALLTLACAAGCCLLMNLLVRDRYLLQHFVAMGESYIKYRRCDIQARNSLHRIAYRNSLLLSTTQIA